MNVQYVWRDQTVRMSFGIAIVMLLSASRYYADAPPSLSNEGSVKKSGRCVAFVNACKDYDLELKISVYVPEEQKRLLKRKLSFAKGVLARGKEKVYERVFAVPRGQIVSFNQKPLTSATGTLTYFASIEVVANDSQTGVNLPAAILPSEQLEKVNHFVASSLSDQAACAESGATQRLSAMVIVQTDAIPNEIEAALDGATADRDEHLASFDNGLSVLVPFRQEKAVLDRIKLHLAQHPRSAKALSSTAKLALAVGRLSTGDVSAVRTLGSSLKGLGEAALEGKHVPGWEKLKEGRVGQVAKKLKPERLLSLAEVITGASSEPTSLLGQAEGALGESEACDRLVHGVVESIRQRQERVVQIIEMIKAGVDMSDQLKVLDELAQQSKAERDAIRTIGSREGQEGQQEALEYLLEVEAQVILGLKDLVFTQSLQSI